MDLFVEQLFIRKNTGKENFFRGLFICILGLCAGMSLFAAIIGIFGIFSPLFIPVAVAICYVAYIVNGKFNMEFEYALTNGDFDIDVIHNRSKRERIVAFECKNIESISIYNPDVDYGGKEITVAANLDGERLLLVEVPSKKGKKVNVVIEPNDKMYSALKKCTPRHLTMHLPE